MINTALAVRLKNSLLLRLVSLLAIPWLRTLANLATGAVLLLLAVKASIELDESWDAGAYHQPWAARLWGIIPQDQLQLLPKLERMWHGFPRLGEFLQGFFWYLSGRPQSTNLLSYLMFVAFLLFLKVRYRVPLRWSAFALLAVPMIQIQVTMSWVDWVGNAVVAIAILLTYDLVVNRPRFNWKDLAGFVSCGATACNIKFAFIPAIGALALIWLPYYIIELNRCPKFKIPQRLVMLFLIPLVAGLFLIVPIKNSIWYANPIYPITHQNYARNQTPHYLAKSPQIVRYTLSLIEYKALEGRPHLWIAAQDSVPHSSDQFKMGGYFGAYFLFNLVVLGYIVWHARSRQAIWGLLFVIGALFLNSQIMGSHLLRHLMYAAILPISINLSLLAPNSGQDVVIRKGIRPTYLIGVASSFIFVVAVTGAIYLMPVRGSIKSLAKPYRSAIQHLRVKRGDLVCVVGKRPISMYYTSYFTGLEEYRVQSARSPKRCGSGSIRLVTGDREPKDRRSSASRRHRRQP